MRVYSRKELKWVRNSLWLDDTYLVAIVPDDRNEGMFRLAWPDGTKSEDFYNISRAKDNAVTYELGKLNNTSRNAL